ncbi:MAG: DUF3341 domain-containing protein [Anaerolineales bacterium]|nr:DUF3341 domain-containing protein [Anaerolineales bacterium]
MENTMNLLGLFRDGTETAQVIDSLYDFGMSDHQVTVMTGVPYPEQSLGRHVDWLRLPNIVLAGALVGFFLGLFLAVITPHLYRLDIGGHPTVGFPPAAVIIFVFTMMAAIVSTFLGVLWEMNFPEFSPKFYDKRVTDGYLAVLVEHDPSEESQVRKIFEQHGCDSIQRPERQLL